MAERWAVVLVQPRVGSGTDGKPFSCVGPFGSRAHAESYLEKVKTGSPAIFQAFASCLCVVEFHDPEL